MRVFVTGGTGFIGAHVVRALVARGDEVRCLVRAESRRDNLEGLAVELVTGDLGAPDSLLAGVRGVQQVYHCAADYRLFARDPSGMYRTNVDGTRNLLVASAEAGVQRVVHTSSVGALGLHANGSPADEDTPVTLDDMIGHYKRSKYQAERIAEEWARRGLDVVIVNPSTPVGELDIKPTPTGQIIVDFLNRRMPATVDTGMNFIDVRDVAQGHLLAAERGRTGRKYILGHANLSLRDLLQVLADLTGQRAPWIRLPHWVPLAVAAVDTRLARWRGGRPRVSLEAVQMAGHKMYFDCSRAVSELGLPQSPLREALERAVDWFRERGYA